MCPPQQPHREKPPMGELQTIAGGFTGRGATLSRKKAHSREARYWEVYSTSYCPTKYKRGEPTLVISFREADEEGVLYPHNDALVVTMQVAYFTTRRILIDNGRSADILFWKTVTLIGIDAIRLLLAPMSLKGFSREKIQLAGTITLSVLVGNAPCTTPIMVGFLVVKPFPHATPSFATQLSTR